MARKILIVDDDTSTRNGLARLVEQGGYVTAVAGTFQDAIRALADEVPDLLITDVRLGEYNGLQLIATAARPIPAIVVTGFSDRALEDEARRFGAAYLVKPVSPAVLLALIEEKLASVPDRKSRPTRQWTRKAVVSRPPAYVDAAAARIVDVSYGGLRFEVDGEPDREFPSSASLTLPTAHLSLKIDVVWSSRRGDRSWLCGAAISHASRVASREWRGLVDAIA